MPDAKLIATLPTSNDRVVLYRFDVESAFEKSDVEFLIITSRPATTASKGADYRYALAAKSKNGSVKYRLESGPAGMAVSDSGELDWPIPAAFTASQVNVIISARDSVGQEAFQTFRIAIQR